VRGHCQNTAKRRTSHQVVLLIRAPTSRPHTVHVVSHTSQHTLHTHQPSCARRTECQFSFKTILTQRDLDVAIDGPSRARRCLFSSSISCSNEKASSRVFHCFLGQGSSENIRPRVPTVIYFPASTFYFPATGLLLVPFLEKRTTNKPQCQVTSSWSNGKNTWSLTKYTGVCTAPPSSL